MGKGILQPLTWAVLMGWRVSDSGSRATIPWPLRHHSGMGVWFCGWFAFIYFIWYQVPWSSFHVCLGSWLQPCFGHEWFLKSFSCFPVWLQLPRELAEWRHAPKGHGLKAPWGETQPQDCLKVKLERGHMLRKGKASVGLAWSTACISRQTRSSFKEGILPCYSRSE